MAGVSRGPGYRAPGNGGPCHKRVMLWGPHGRQRGPRPRTSLPPSHNQSGSGLVRVRVWSGRVWSGLVRVWVWVWSGRVWSVGSGLGWVRVWSGSGLVWVRSGSGLGLVRSGSGPGWGIEREEGGPAAAGPSDDRVRGPAGPPRGMSGVLGDPSGPREDRSREVLWGPPFPGLSGRSARLTPTTGPAA